MKHSNILLFLLGTISINFIGVVIVISAAETTSAPASSVRAGHSTTGTNNPHQGQESTIMFTGPQADHRNGNANRNGNDDVQDESTASAASQDYDPWEQNLLDAMATGEGSNGYPTIVKARERGSLGKLDLHQLLSLDNSDNVNVNVNDHNHRFLSAMGGSGNEKLWKQSIHLDDDGFVHVRFVQQVQGLFVEGAALVVHAEPDGTIDSVNGELVLVDQVQEDELASLTTVMTMATRMMKDNGGDDGGGGDPTSSGGQGQRLLDQAAREAGVPPDGNNGTWVGEPAQLAIVRRPSDGSACLAWKRMYQYYALATAATSNNTNGSSESGRSLHVDMVFADAMANNQNRNHDNIFSPATTRTTIRNATITNKNKPLPVLCARHPKIMGSGGIPSLKTYDCNGRWTIEANCDLKSQESGPIFTNDEAVNAAHNHALATYNYFWKEFGRDSMDNAGMTIVSRVHFGEDYNNAFWDGTRMSYGDGDGVVFLPLSLGLDVVAHELTHALTSSSSKLIYHGESGALNEAMSDIFAALVERAEGGNENQIWLLGESIYTPGIAGDAIRNLKDPEATGGHDYYPTRYKGTADNEGVHSNSGIANLAFYLLVKGGGHPRQKTNIAVPAIGYLNAAYIFYHANVDCLTPSSTFYMARVCTADTFGGNYTEAVHLAWDAVGVPRNPPTTTPLMDGVTLRGQAGALWDVLRYTLLGPVKTGEKVHCEIEADNGDADLYLRFDAPAERYQPRIRLNECSSFTNGSNEECVTGAAPSSNTKLHITVHAFRPFSKLSILCRIIPAPSTLSSLSVVATPQSNVSLFTSNNNSQSSAAGATPSSVLPPPPSSPAESDYSSPISVPAPTYEPSFLRGSYSDSSISNHA